jgi:SMODS-associating 2TM, beta-strand rich effector domain
MRTASVIRGTAYVVTFVWSGVIAVNGLHLSSTWSKVVSIIPIALVLAFAAWDKWLWRLPPFIFIAGRPDLNGTWLGSFDAQWLDANQKLNESTEPVALVMEQSFTSLSVTLVAERSTSYSILSSIRHLESGEYRISYEYANTPFVKFRQQLPAHNGSTELKVSQPRASRLTGEYWTNRLSRGALDLTWISKRRASSLAEAQAFAPETRKGGN